MLTPLQPGETEDLTMFLRADIGGSVFPLVNLSGRGLPMRSWIARAPGGRIKAFLGLTEDGMAMPQASRGTGDETWSSAAIALAGQAVSGLIGRPAQVTALRTALGLHLAATRKEGIEQGFDLPLEALHPPPQDPAFSLLPVSAACRDLAISWRAAYESEVLAADPASVASGAAATVGHWLRANSHRLLLMDGHPVALTGFNADLGDLVQVGGVYVPPPARCRGLARRAVALHLAEARKLGAMRALLFAMSAPAIRAYRAIGFRPAGDIALVLFATPQRVRP